MPRTMIALAALFAALNLTTASASAQALYVVAADGSGDYTDFPPIAPPIQSGDGLIVKSGTYHNDLDIDGYELFVFARKGATVTITGDVTVRNVPAGKRVVLEGLHSQSGSTATHEVKANLGHVWIEDCTLEGGASGLTVTNSANVVVTRSTFRGDTGLVVDSPHVSLWTTVAEARDPATVGASAGAGLAVGPNGTAFAIGSTFAGGDGGDGDASCTPVGLGGDGVQVDGTATYEYWDVVHLPGLGGSYVGACTGPSGDGATISGAGAVTPHPYSALRTEDSGPTAYGWTVRLDTIGVSGTPFQLATWPIPAYGVATLPGVGRIVLTELGDAPGGVVGQPSETVLYSQDQIEDFEVVVAFVQPGYLPGGPVYCTGGPTAVIFHREIGPAPTTQ